MSSIVLQRKSAPLALRIVRVTTAVVTVLALAGAVATATLIFAAGLSVLWPALIACACLTVLCAVGFLIAHCIIASTPLFRKVVEDCITLLNAMPKDTPLSNALRTLGKKKGITISGSDTMEICGCIKKLVTQKTESEISNLTLGDLSLAQTNKIIGIEESYLEVENLSNCLPIFIATLEMIPNSRFFIRIMSNYMIRNCSLGKKFKNIIKSYITPSTFSTFNYGNSKSIPEDQQEITQETVKQIGRDNVFVTHYNSNGALVIDPPPQVESQDESEPTFE